MVKVASILVMLAMALLLSSCASFFNPEKKYHAVIKDAPFDAVIVPGFPHEKDNWSIVVKCRVYWAVYLYNKGIAKNIIFSGSAVYTPYVESEVMALYAEEMGVPRQHIFVETKAEHTSENLYYSYQLAKKKGFNNIAVASDVIQCSFLKRFKRRFNLHDVQFIPIIYTNLELRECPDPVINDEKAFVKDFVSLKERESFFERYRGTTGRKVRMLIHENNQYKNNAFQTDKAYVEQNTRKKELFYD